MNGLLIKNPIVDLPIKMKENLKRTLCNSLGGGGKGGKGGGGPGQGYGRCFADY